MAKQPSKQSSSSKSKPKSSSSKTTSGQGSFSSTVPVDRSWQNQSLDRSRMSAGGSGSYGVGRWLTEPSWQEPFNTIAEVPAAGSTTGDGGWRQGSDASATYATSRTQQHR